MSIWNPKQTRANTYRCRLCGGGIVLHTDECGPYGCPLGKAAVAEDLNLTAEQATRGYDDGSKA